MKKICLETTAISVAVLNALGRALRQAEVAIPIQVAQTCESALFAKLVEISVRSLGAIGLSTHWFNGNYGVTRAEKS